MAADNRFITKLTAGLKSASVRRGAKLVIAFSGGPDSCALLSGLSELRVKWNFSLAALHVNHTIRPERAHSDQTNAKKIAELFGVEFVSIAIDVREAADELRLSIETTARQLRYQALSTFARDNRADGVVTGHSLDDQAETVLLHASRGSGIKGIAGMNPCTTLIIPASNVEVTVLRPMLHISRSEVEQYLDIQGISPVIDESNYSREFTRNRIRLDVLPILNEVIPSSSESLARLADNASNDLEIIDWVVNQNLNRAKLGRNTYSRSIISSLPSNLVARLLMRAYANRVGHAQDLEHKHVVEMARQVTERSGLGVDLPNGIRFVVDRDSLGFQSGNEDDCPYPEPLKPTELALPGTTELNGGFILSTEMIERPVALNPNNPWVAFTSPEIASLAPKLRNRKNGDRFQPLGMEPLVKLQDYLVGAGIPERWRDRVPIVESSKGIVWIVGSRLAQWAKVQAEHSQVARLELMRTD